MTTMRCSNCDFENPAGMKFCGQCGTPFKNRCPSCDFENPPDFKFCGECGTSLSLKSEASSQKDEAVHPSDEAERRQLTVMFCDLVGSTALSEQLDVETLREVIRAYQQVCAEAVSRFDGYIAKYIGDGLLVYFGYPQAHEDDPLRAVRTGLGILAGMAQLNTRLQQDNGVELGVRLGIHTGLVVAGEMGSGQTREALAIVGRTPNIAARLEGLAPANTVVISPDTYRLVKDFFVCQSLGTHPLKGIAEPMEIYQVSHEAEVQSRLEAATTSLAGLIPLVGREQETALLLDRWERAKAGTGQVVLLSGEAGIGKSRLVHMVKERLADESHIAQENRCSPYYQNSALHPVIDLLERWLRFERGDTPQEKLDKLETTLDQYSSLLQSSETIPLLAALLSVPPEERYPALTLTPQRQREKTLEALLRLLLETAAQQPLLFIFEDLHWADPSTLNLLTMIVDQVPTARILALFTFRPTFHPPWSSRSYLTQLTLGHLPAQQTEAIVNSLTGGKPLPAEVMRQLVIKTDGVPLFVEELTKMVLESGLLREGEERYELAGPLPPLAIPATLRDSLTARLDRLVSVKEVAQLGATLGREFSYELLQAISSLDEARLQSDLARLVEAELLYRQGLPPQARYIFKHALIQEAAYRSLLRSKRQQTHQRVAQILEEQFPETVETQPELIAHHYTEAGLSEQAIPYWLRAGKWAVQRSANAEGINHFNKGLTLLETLPDTPERAPQELELQIALGNALVATKGYAAPEVGETFTKARKLCQQIGETAQLFPVLHGLHRFYLVGAELPVTRELAEQFMRLAQQQHDPTLLVAAHRVTGTTSWMLGEFKPALEHFEQGFALYKPQHHPSHIPLYGQDEGMTCLCYAALALWCLGYPDQAVKRSREALTLAEELAHPFSKAYALNYAAWLHQFRWEALATQEHAEAAIAICAEQGFTLWEAWGTILLGWAVAGQERQEEGIMQLRTGIANWEATGALLPRHHYISLLAEQYGKMGRSDEGLAVVNEALAAVPKAGRFWEAELYRLKGELLLNDEGEGMKDEDQISPEACFLKAIEVARQQEAKSLELRATVSLSRLWHSHESQDKKEEARQMLGEIYDWFSEGFDTVDLQEAKALLEELA